MAVDAAGVTTHASSEVGTEPMPASTACCHPRGQPLGQRLDHGRSLVRDGEATVRPSSLEGREPAKGTRPAPVAHVGLAFEMQDVGSDGYEIVVQTPHRLAQGDDTFLFLDGL